MGFAQTHGAGEFSAGHFFAIQALQFLRAERLDQLHGTLGQAEIHG